MVKRELKQNCKRAVCKGVKRRAEKETVKDSEKDTDEMSANLSYVTETDRIARKETLKCGEWRTTMKLEVRRSLCERNGQDSREENSEVWEREKYNDMEMSRGVYLRWVNRKEKKGKARDSEGRNIIK